MGNVVHGGTAEGKSWPGRTKWNLLLLIPLLMTLYPPLYNRIDPSLFGIPFFYWYQLAAVAAGSACTCGVYFATRR